MLIATPGSCCGKTMVTLALIQALQSRGLKVGSFKVGPDRRDPLLHSRVSGLASTNLDSWAMRIETLGGLGDQLAKDVDFVIGEGMAGLFDGALIEQGATADIASLFDLPVILALEASRLGASAAALVKGFIHHREDVDIAGVIFINPADDDHADMLKRACDHHFSQPIVGFLKTPLNPPIASDYEERQHSERSLEDELIDWRQLDLDQLQRLARPFGLGLFGPRPCPLRPLGQRIAVADDAGFALAYPAILDGWRQAGAEILPFSPLANEAPSKTADAVYLVGPVEGLAGRLAAKDVFLDGLSQAAKRSAFVYGEGGGIAALGEHWVDQTGANHEMAGLLPMKTFTGKKNLRPPSGYRSLTLQEPCPLGPAGTTFRGHTGPEASIERTSDGQALFQVKDPRGRDLGEQGIVEGSIAGSLIHLIDRVAEPGDGDFRAGPIRLVQD